MIFESGKRRRLDTLPYRMTTNATARRTLAGDVAERMRVDILTGRLRPSQKLMFRELCERYSVSVGVAREALAFLVARGLVIAEPHLGYTVRGISEEDLGQLTDTRLTIEPAVLRLSVEQGDALWQRRVADRYAALQDTPPDDPAHEAPLLSDAWVLAHEAFHTELFTGCGNARLIAFTSALADQASLYRLWARPPEGDPPGEDEHAGIVEAVIADDAELASTRLRDHIALRARQQIDQHLVQPVGASVLDWRRRPTR
jgi:DNA-binding GntR family transcriptional regulator